MCTFPASKHPAHSMNRTLPAGCVLLVNTLFMYIQRKDYKPRERLMDRVRDSKEENRR